MRKEIENIAHRLNLKISNSQNSMELADSSFKLTIRFVDNNAYFFVSRKFGIFSTFYSNKKIRLLINEIDTLSYKYQINFQKLHLDT